MWTAFSSHRAYMAGFGLLCTASGFFLPLGWSLAVYAAVFPIVRRARPSTGCAGAL